MIDERMSEVDKSIARQLYAWECNTYYLDKQWVYSRSVCERPASTFPLLSSSALLTVGEHGNCNV